MIPLFKVFMADSVKDAVNDVLYSGYITQGPVVQKYEQKLQEVFRYKNLLTVNSGTSALQLALDVAGVKAGDIVVSTPQTCSATNTAIVSRQASIVWADVDPASGNMTPETVDAAIRYCAYKPKAIVMVHWGGTPCDIAGICEVAHRYGIKVIDDAAHAIGALHRGSPLGTYTDFSCFSTQAIKHLTTVDGGFLLTATSKDYEQAKLLRWFGIDRDGPKTSFRCELDLPRAGYKYHMNDVNAAIGIENLKHTVSVVEAHRANAAYYNRRIGNRSIQPQAVLPTDTSSNWLYTIRLPNRELRNLFELFMSNNEVQCSQVHAPNHHHTFASEFYPKDLPGVELFSSTQTNIPVGWWVTPADREFIADLVDIFERKYC